MSDRRPDVGITDPGYRGGGVTDGPRKFKPPIANKLKPDVDYAETLLEAIDTTVTTRIQQAHLDKTVLCTVLESDWTNVEKGEYYVSEGDAKYMAIGEPNAYRTRDRVWVLIPLGDYNNQKTIIGRQVGDVGDSFVYISPLENFVRLTEDLVPNVNKGEYGLKTNNTKYSIPIASINMEADDAVDIAGFSAFGISAKFRTDMAVSQVVRGNYGLHLVVTSVKEEIIGTESGSQYVTHSPVVDNLYLQCIDMWGNPYGYDMFFEQSKMFEINDPGRTRIKDIKVYFFQTYDSEDKTIIDEIDAIDRGKFVDINHLNVPVPEENNIFVKELSIYFGHTADNLNTNAYLYSQNSPNFIVKDNNPEDINDKTLVAKFIHKADDGKNYVLNNLGDNPIYQQLLKSGSLPDKFKVRWYVYNPKSTINDMRAGSGWDDIADFIPSSSANRCLRIADYGSYEDIEKDNTLYTDTNRTFRLDDANAGYEKFKVAFILFDSGLDGKTAPGEQEVAEANAAIQNIGGTYSPEDQEAAQQVLDNYELFQKEVRYWSQEVTFNNGDDQTWGSLDTLNSLRLEFDDKGYNGNYLIYNTAASGQAKMLNSADAQVKRTLIGLFKSYITGETDLTRNQIRWYIPKKDTMISEPDWKDVHFTGYAFSTASGTYTNQNPAIRWEPLNGKKATYSDGTWTITDLTDTIRPDIDIDTEETWNNYYIFASDIDASKTAGLTDLQNGKITIQYRIKEYWNQHFTNNTIMCKIIRDGKLYEKSVDLKFGAHGTNGTEYSLIAELRDEYWVENPSAPINEQVIRLIDKNVPAWCSGHDKNSYITLFCQLYDERNKELPAKDVQYSWTVEQFTGGLSNANIFEVVTVTASDGTKEYRLQIKSGRRSQNSITDDDWVGAYLKCTATYKNNEYSQYLLVPIRISEKYIGCVGTTQAIYTYANTAPSVSSKDKYQILNDDYSLGDENHRETIAVYDSTVGLPDVQTVNNKLSVYTDLPYLSNIKRSNVPVNERARQLATLILPPMYYADVNYKMSVRMLNAQGKALWAQPVLITRDVFTNSFLNQWDGSLIIDNKANRIGTAAVFAGNKNADNSFTGVIMGELQGENPTPNETGYGIYGRNNGNHTFGLNIDGTAYLGDSSHAQLLFKVGTNKTKTNDTTWESTIQNDGYNKPTANRPKGMKLDFLGNTTLQDGTEVEAPYIDIVAPTSTSSSSTKLNRVTISANRQQLLHIVANDNPLMHVGTSEYYLQTADYKDDNTDARLNTGTKLNLKTGEFLSYGKKDTNEAHRNHALLISNQGVHGDWTVNSNQAGGNGWVLYSHGNFGVDTNGNLYADNGNFAGTVTATAGKIGGWNIGTDTNKSLYYDNQTPGATTSNLVLSPSSNTNSNAIAGSDTGLHWFISAGRNFGVTTGGVLYANGGHFNGGSISGGSINIGNGTFKVTSGGALTATSAYIEGEIHASSGSFSGSIDATSGTFRGTIYASAGTLGNVTIKNTCSTSGLIVGGDNFSNKTAELIYVNSITPTWDEWRTTYNLALSSTSGDYSVSVGPYTLYYSYNTSKIRAITDVNPSRYRYSFQYLGTGATGNTYHD